MAEGFDPRTHRPGESKYFEDLVVGQKFYIPSRTISEAHFVAFQAASADNHPIHYDVEYCRARGMPNLLAHGFQVLILTCAGASQFPHELGESLVGSVTLRSREGRSSPARGAMIPHAVRVTLLARYFYNISAVAPHQNGSGTSKLVTGSQV